MVWKAIVLACALLAPASAFAQKKLNAGPYGNTYFQFTGRGIKSDVSSDGSLTITTDSIETINCNGCDRREFYPGYLFNVRNNSKKPVCFQLQLTLAAGEYNGVTSWGNGQIFLLKPGQTFERIGGVTMNFSRRQVNLGYTLGLRGWSPISKKTCGSNPYA